MNHMLHRICLLLVLMASLAAADGLALDGRRLTGPRQVLTLAESGLPEQVSIAAQVHELPLEHRAKPDQVKAEVLKAIGRGDQLTAPMTLVASIGGKTVPAQVVQAGELGQDGNGAGLVTTALGFAEVKATLTTRYTADGSLRLSLDVTASPTVVDALDLLIPLGGLDTLACAATDGSLRAFLLPASEGVIFGDQGDDLPRGEAPLQGRPLAWFVGDGDRGLACFPENIEAWGLDPAASLVRAERDSAGALSLRLRLINRSGPVVAGVRTWTLVFLPSHRADAGDRGRAWLDLGETTAPKIPITASARPAAGIVPAEAAAFFGTGDLAIIAGNTQALPPALLRFLACTHSGLPVRIVDPPSEDQKASAILGRALVHGIGVDVRSLRERSEALAVVRHLKAFTALDAGGAVEFIPWWRAASVVRFGTPAQSGDAFALETSDPLQAVRCAIYRRRNGKGTEVLIALVNDGDVPLRENLHLLAPKSLLGAGNALTYATLAQTWDYSRLPTDSDWSADNILHRPSRGDGRFSKLSTVLQDVIDGSPVRLAGIEGGAEVYGVVYLPPRSMRLLRASSVVP